MILIVKVLANLGVEFALFMLLFALSSIATTRALRRIAAALEERNKRR